MVAPAAAHAPVPPQEDSQKASKELGMGMPCPSDPNAADQACTAFMCNEDNRFDVVESSEWMFDFPMLDPDIANAFGPTIDVFATPNGNPPKGITGAYNTLSVPGMPNSNMVIWGLIVRFSVEAEGRLIRGNYVIPGAGQTQPQASPDVFDTQDVTAGIFGGQATPIPGELLTGFPQWRFAYDMAMGYGLNFLKEHQTSFIRQPLKGLAIISPFATAEACGTAFASNIDRIKAYNDRVQQIGFAPNGVFLPITHKRIGTWLGYAAGATQGGDFPPTREEDASPTMFGALGFPENPFAPSPLLFTRPAFWPRGAPVSIQLEVLGNAGAPWQADMQRWLSITGGTNGAAGQDLNLPLSGILSGLTLAGPNEQSLDPVAQAVSVIVNTNRMLGKIGKASIFIGLLGKRIRQDWMKPIARAVKAGLVQTPMGYGDLTHYVESN
jgi:hypothetical protein